MQHAEKLEILTFFKFEEEHDILTLWTKLIPNMTKAFRKIHFLKKIALKIVYQPRIGLFFIIKKFHFYDILKLQCFIKD